MEYTSLGNYQDQFDFACNHLKIEAFNSSTYDQHLNGTVELFNSNIHPDQDEDPVEPIVYGKEEESSLKKRKIIEENNDEIEQDFY